MDLNYDFGLTEFPILISGETIVHLEIIKIFRRPAAFGAEFGYGVCDPASESDLMDRGMFNYKNYDPPVEPREKEVGIESLKILTDFANMTMSDRDSSNGG